MPNSKTLILDHKQIEQKINRIAYQIYENNYDNEKVIIAGIADNGYIFAQLLEKKIKEISSLTVILVELNIDKKNPINSNIELDITIDDFKNQSVLLVDDVLNSGKTMMYGLQHFLTAPIKKLSTVVLVNRSHKRFPVYANFVGISLATTLKEHIEVSFEKGKYAAYLS